ncbi:MAG: hypothetical protein R3C02_07895 [Planctomycetaceae bacterium]
MNEKLLQEEKRRTSTLLRQILGNQVGCCGRGRSTPLCPRKQADASLRPGRRPPKLRSTSPAVPSNLALTATPFELTPHELVNLLALVRAEHAELDRIEIGLKNFVRALDRFFELRDRSPNDLLREQHVTRLERLRDVDSCDGGGTNQGLQTLLRRYLIRNTKRQNERRYYLLERGADGFDSNEFHKLDEDLQQRVRKSPLIPFEGEDTLFYLELRELIQEVTGARSRGRHFAYIHSDGPAPGAVFVPPDRRVTVVESGPRQRTTPPHTGRPLEQGRQVAPEGCRAAHRRP